MPLLAKEPSISSGRLRAAITLESDTILEIEITADDPEAFTGPWKTTRYGALAPDHEILEFVCPENNKDMQSLFLLIFYLFLMYMYGKSILIREL